MATKKQEQYGNSSISMLKGEDRVRKRPAVIFGSDDLEGCKHAVFEILSNAIDEAREGHGDTIIVTRYDDLSVEVEDFGRGCPVDYNEKEKRYNWELVFCEMYAGGKYGENGENYEYSLGLNGLGSCATQYASEYFDVTVRRDGYRYDLHFEKGRNKGGLKKQPADRKKTGSVIRWKPDKQVLPKSTSPWNTTGMCCGGRPWSTKESASGSAIRSRVNSRPRNTVTRTALSSILRSWLVTTPSPCPPTGRPSAGAGMRTTAQR